MRRDKATSGFGGPHVDPRVTDPKAMKYAQEAQARHEAGRYTAPVGGGPNPPIPRLDMPHHEGMTMADQARMAAQPPPGLVGGDSIFPTAPAPKPSQDEDPRATMSRPPPALFPADLLPEAARQDPEFIEGQGSMYAVAQPKMAYKHGIIRNKQFITPAQLTGEQRPGQLSEKTVEALKAVQALQQGKPVGVPLEQQAKDQEAGRVNDEATAAATAGAAGSVANIGGGAEQLTDEDRKKIKQAIDQMDDFDWNTFKQMTMKDLLNNDEQKKIIEERLKDKPLSLDELVVNSFVRQRVPIIIGKFEPTFQSLGGDEDLACKRMLVLEAKTLDTSEQYLTDKFSFMQLCCGIYSINNTILPSHRDEAGNFDDKKFWEKFNKVIKYPLHMLASLSIHFFWFDVRVRSLFVADRLSFG
jgi:hypothetical protein